VAWIQLAWGTTVQRRACCEHGNELSGSIKGGYLLTTCATISFIRKTVLHGVIKSYRTNFLGILKVI